MTVLVSVDRIVRRDYVKDYCAKMYAYIDRCKMDRYDVQREEILVEEDEISGRAIPEENNNGDNG